MTDKYKSYFQTFASVSKQIHANRRTPEILSCIVENITQILEARGCIFWILNTEEQVIQTKICQGFDFRSLSLTDYPTLMTLFPENHPDPIEIPDARNDPRIPDLERLGKHLINAVTGRYFHISGPFSGLLAVYFTGSRRLDSQEMELVTALGEQGAIALEKALGYDREMLALYSQIIEGLALAIEARDPLTHGHSQTVAKLAEATARTLDLNDDEVEKIYHAAILHDIGKIGTRDAILDRLGKLDRAGMKAIRRHPSLGADILRPLTFLQGVAPLVRCHHELFNGTGYPDGIKGEAIPLGARILTVCDAFETIISGRPGLAAKDLPTALTALKDGAGEKFDPEVVQAFFDMMRAHPNILENGSSADMCLSILTQNIRALADRNRIEKKLASPFSGFF